MNIFAENQEIFIALLVKLGIIASLAALLARSQKFKKTLFAEPREFREKLHLILFWGVPLAVGVAIRFSMNYDADLTLRNLHCWAARWNVVGLIVGCLVGVTALLNKEWLALPLFALFSLTSGILRNLCSNKEIWASRPLP
jgi:hypothetical protein